MRYLLINLFILLLISCGADETPAPEKIKQNYLPDTVGSEWVYRNDQGNQWSWVAAGDKSIDEIDYRIVENSSDSPETIYDVLVPTYNRMSDNKILLNISEKIDSYIQTSIPNAIQNAFVGLETRIETDPILYPELTLLHTPLLTDLHWDAFYLEIKGDIIVENLTLLTIPFDANVNIKAEVIAEVPLKTPADAFETAYQIEYQIDTNLTALSDEHSLNHQQTIWFVPHVGIVKTEDERGITELIEYTLK